MEEDEETKQKHLRVIVDQSRKSDPPQFSVMGSDMFELRLVQLAKYAVAC